jgi:hypothetical protein
LFDLLLQLKLSMLCLCPTPVGTDSCSCIAKPYSIGDIPEGGGE